MDEANLQIQRGLSLSASYQFAVREANVSIRSYGFNGCIGLRAVIFFGTFERQLRPA